MIHRVFFSGAACVLFAVGSAACGSAGGGTRLPTVTLSAAPTEISSGQSVTLTWSSSDASSCQASGSWNGSPPTSGSNSFQIYNPGTHVFVLTCTGAGGSDAKAVNVNVSGGSTSPGTPIVYLAADPTVVAVGDSTTLTWSTDSGQTCTASGAWSGTKAPTGSESIVVNSSGSNFFGLTCHASGGNGFSGVYVEGLQATIDFSVAPATVGAGQTTTLSWTSTNASACTASGAWSGAKSASGTEQVTVPTLDDHLFTLTCSGPGAASTNSVTATAVVPAVTFRAFPDEITAGETVTLNWDAPYAQGCTASGGWSGTEPVKGLKTFVVSTASTVNYVLTCSNAGGTEQKSLSVTTKAAPALPPATAYQMNPRHDGFIHFAGGVKLPASATPLWSRDLGAPTSYPLIAEGLVIVATENPDDSYGSRLFALNQATGAIAWGPIALSGTYNWQGIAYANGRVFALNFDGNLRAFTAATGAAIWSRQLAGYWYHSAPTAYGGMVFATGNGGLFGLDEATGAIRWTNAMAGDSSSPAVTSSGLYTMQVCRAVGVNPLTGEDLWVRQAGCSGGGGANASIGGGLMYARYFDGTYNSAHLFDTTTGEDAGEIASARIPALNDKLAITYNAGTLAATNITTGNQTWSFSGDGQLVSAPIVVNDMVFVGSSTGKVFAVNSGTGLQKWVGTAPAAIEAPDEWNIRSMTGLAAGEGLLVVPAGQIVSAWRLN